jgi:uncharacterized protein
MLPTDLLISRQNGETIIPKKLSIDDEIVTIATQQIECFQEYLGKTQGELDRRLLELEGDSPDYRLRRGFAHLIRSNRATFEIVSPIEPEKLRTLVFSEAAKTATIARNRVQTLDKVATKLSDELKREVLLSEVERGLYADLQENRILTQIEPTEPEFLIHFYNLSQVQGIFYRASQLIINAYRNDPGEYKLLFRYLKLFQLMFYVEGDADTGFTITIDGPTSLFNQNTRYGLAIAKMIPALLHVSKWSLLARLQSKDPYSGGIKTGSFRLDDKCTLVSHYPKGKTYDSMLEESFANSWAKLKTEWKLEREVNVVPLPGSVMIPDFRLVHPDGRDFLLEIVGYWRPEYLQKKFYQVRRAEARNLILAVSERLNLEKAGVKFTELPARLIWFKDRLLAKVVLEVVDREIE